MHCCGKETRTGVWGDSVESTKSSWLQCSQTREWGDQGGHSHDSALYFVSGILLNDSRAQRHGGSDLFSAESREQISTTVQWGMEGILCLSDCIETGFPLPRSAGSLHTA